jgi:hypothetical protein
LKVAAVIIFCLLSCPSARSQATLPALQCERKQRMVTVSWNNQYDHVKRIVVSRSSDSASGYTPIGDVKQPDTGWASYTDLHAMPGKNYYRLSVIFRSGVSWNSNFCGCYIERSQMEEQLNAEQQKKQASPVQDTIPVHGEVVKVPDHTPLVTAHDTVAVPTPHTVVPIAHRPKVNISFDDPTASPNLSVRSAYIFVDSLTGHIDMRLPDDVTAHHYSVRFCDVDGNTLFEVPRLHSARIIFDRRNFQHKGIYKFVIRRDVVELESGYVRLN